MSQGEIKLPYYQPITVTEDEELGEIVEYHPNVVHPSVFIQKVNLWQELQIRTGGVSFALVGGRVPLTRKEIGPQGFIERVPDGAFTLLRADAAALSGFGLDLGFGVKYSLVGIGVGEASRIVAGGDPLVVMGTREGASVDPSLPTGVSNARISTFRLKAGVDLDLRLNALLNAGFGVMELTDEDGNLRGSLLTLRAAVLPDTRLRLKIGAEVLSVNASADYVWGEVSVGNEIVIK